MIKMMNIEDDYSINFTNRNAPTVVVSVDAGVADAQDSAVAAACHYSGCSDSANVCC